MIFSRQINTPNDENISVASTSYSFYNVSLLYNCLQYQRKYFFYVLKLITLPPSIFGSFSQLVFLITT